MYMYTHTQLYQACKHLHVGAAVLRTTLNVHENYHKIFL